MANNWKTNDISFEQSMLELGKTHDVMPGRLNEQGGRDDEQHKEEVKKSLPPWMTQPGDEMLSWEMKREKKLEELRKNNTYQFVMLVTSFTNEKMDRYWLAPSEVNAEHTGVKDVGTTTAGQCSLKGVRNSANTAFHKYYVDTPWVDQIIYLSPAMFGHIEEAYVAITQRYAHLRNVKLNLFTDTARIRTMFAKLVAMCIRSSDFLSQKRYNLDATYSRINMEKRRLMNYWSHVRQKNGVLMYFHSNGAHTDIKMGIGQIGELTDNNMDDLFQLSLNLGRNL